jgi:hypothetical protein
MPVLLVPAETVAVTWISDGDPPFAMAKETELLVFSTVKDRSSTLSVVFIVPELPDAVIFVAFSPEPSIETYGFIKRQFAPMS